MNPSNRSYNIRCSDSREAAFQQLMLKLEARDLEVARLQQMYNDTASEIADLRRIARRETVNMDYLKNVIYQVGVIE